MVHALVVRLSSCGCTWEVVRVLKKLEKHPASPAPLKRFSRALPTSRVHSQLDRRTLSMMDHFLIRINGSDVRIQLEKFC